MKKVILFLALSYILAACSKEEAKITTPLVANFTVYPEVDKFELNASTSSGPPEFSLHWKASAQGIEIKNIITSTKSYFRIPADTTITTVDITLTASDGTNTQEQTSTIAIPKYSKSRAMGLGVNVVKATTNEVPYEWYYDQGNSGEFAGVNCGPTSVTMAIKWVKKNFAALPEDARHAYRSGGGWWHTDDILNYLKDNGVASRLYSYATDALTRELDNGNIAILCLDMSYVERLDDFVSYGSDYRYDKFYEAQGRGWGHFIVIKGYTIVDGKIFFEVNDPYSLGEKNEDATLKGKSRYYKDKDLSDAVNNWWAYIIVVSRNESSGGRTAGIPWESVVHQKGR